MLQDSSSYMQTIAYASICSTFSHITLLKHQNEKGISIKTAKTSMKKINRYYFFLLKFFNEPIINLLRVSLYFSQTMPDTQHTTTAPTASAAAATTATATTASTTTDYDDHDYTTITTTTTITTCFQLLLRYTDDDDNRRRRQSSTTTTTTTSFQDDSVLYGFSRLRMSFHLVQRDRSPLTTQQLNIFECTMGHCNSAQMPLHIHNDNATNYHRSLIQICIIPYLESTP